MKRQDFYPQRYGDQVVWLANFREKLPGYAAVLGLAANQVTAAVADCAWLEYLLLQWLPAARAWEKACTSALNQAQSGVSAGPMVLPVFTAPALPAEVTAVAAGALSRIFALVQTIKRSGHCTQAIGTDLGILRGAASPPDLGQVQPVLGASVSGSEVLVRWKWQGWSRWLSSCEIQVDRADGKGFVLLTIDTTPGFTDTHPFPATRTIWTYKAIYRADDAQVGRWSQPVSVMVGG